MKAYLLTFASVIIFTVISKAQNNYSSPFLDVQGPIYLRDHAYTLNNAGDGWLRWVARNTSHSDVKIQLENILSINPHGGQLGIGTYQPFSVLHVAGQGSDLNVGNSKAVSGDLVIQSNTGSRSFTSGAQLEFAIPANIDGSNPWGQARIITVAGNSHNGSACGKMILGTRRSYDKYGQGSQWFYGDDLVIDGVGNVGMGTLSPDQKLTVKGKIHTEEVIVDLNIPAPDYVFESNYELLPLSEIESYVKQNKHLPEVPSSKDMQENGINLKEINLILLKKVEELTLHLIAMEKINKDQSTRIEKLECSLIEQSKGAKR